MALIFSSGGGRLGNQILNLIHLIALSIEYNIEVFKLNDPFLTSRNRSLMFKVQKDSINWKINLKYYNSFFLNKLFQKFIIRFLHLYFYISPFSKSYKIGSKSNFPKFVIGNNLKKDFSINKLIKESKFSNVVISGWGLRDWQMVKKHKNKIVEYLIQGINSTIKKKSFNGRNYLLVHIRRSDFLKVNDYEELNFQDHIWIKSISNLCKKKSIKDVVIFSDSNISDRFISNLSKSDLNVLIPEIRNNHFFYELFFNYVFHASLVICNSSSLVLSISFLSHEEVYLPTKKGDYKKVFLNNAHNVSPTCLNWN